MSGEMPRQRIRDLLARVRGVRLAYLFGSRVDRTTGPMSDYDVAVLFDQPGDQTLPRTQLAHELGVVLDMDRVDVVSLNRAPVELAYAVIAQGEVLYQSDEATRVEYEASVMARYGDYLPILRAQRRDIVEGGEHAARVQRYRETLGRTERTLGQIRAAQGESARRL